MEEGGQAVSQDPVPQSGASQISEAQTIAPGSDAATEQIVIDSALAPELESLSSGSEPEDQFYEASEEPSVEQQQSSESVGANQDGEDEGVAEDIEQKSNEGLTSVEEHDGGGVSKAGGDSSCEQQHSMDSVDKEFVMVNYPATGSDQSDTQRPHVGEDKVTIDTSPQESTTQQAIGTSPQTTDASPTVGSSDTSLTVVKGAKTVQSEDGNQSSLSPTKAEIIISSSALPESAESAQGSADSSGQEATRNVVEGGSEGDQRGSEGGGSQIMMERESSDAKGEKGQISAPAFESLGLLYASSPNIKHNRYSL